MFYGAFVLAKKGPLAKVWLAAHWDKKLTKAHVFETDVEATVDSIISPQVKMALRTSGHLLLGVVRIYSRKQKYLIHDLGEACAKIKMAFRPGIVDLPSDNGALNADAITLPEMFHDFEASVANLETLNLEGQFTVNPSRASEITIAEDPSTTSGAGDIFGDFDNFGGKDGDFGSTMEDIEIPRNLTHSKLDEDKSATSINKISDTLTSDDPSKGMAEMNGRVISDATADFGGEDEMAAMFADGELPQISLPDEALQQVSLPDLEEDNTTANVTDKVEEMEVDVPPEDHTTALEKDDSTLVEDTAAPPPAPAEEESFVLEQVEQPKGMEERRSKRKRRLVVDTDKEFTGQQIKSQFDDYKDLLQPKFFPPPTKKAMRWKEMAGCDQLFSNPTISSLCQSLAKVVTRNYHMDIPGAPPGETINISELNLPEPAPEDTSIPPEVNVLDDTNQESRVEPPAPEVDLGGLGEDNMMQFDQENLPGLAGVDPTVDPDEDATTSVIPDIVDFDDALPTQSTEEQQSEEQTEEFEQRRWTKRTQNVLGALQHSLESSAEVELSLLTTRCNRKQAASRFYTCLLLSKEGMITVDQQIPYGPIKIRKGPKLIEP